MINLEFSDWLTSVHRNAQQCNHRAAIIMSGEQDWGRQQAQQVIAQLNPGSLLVVSSEIEGALSAKKAQTQLGNETDAILFDAYKGIEPDALGAVSGTLRGGGIFILLIPSENSPSINNYDRFMQRAMEICKQHHAIYMLQPKTALPGIYKESSKVKQQQCDKPFCTMEQQQVVNTIQNNAVGDAPVPLVITSDRGRGKSSALGFAAGYLLKQDLQQIIVTAPRLSTTEPVFKHAQQVLSEAELSRGELHYHDSQLKFITPDALIEAQPKAQLLLVDEAAAIPLPMLEQLLALYPHIVFASTIHGYEGTGRGFALKFNKVLDEINPGWQQLNMKTPIRWADHDPVEQWVDRLLCLDADLTEVAGMNNIALDNCTVKLIDRDELVKDEQKLSSLFALLVYAHYRTQPSDLQHTLDDANVRIYTLEQQGKILAAVLVNEEGGFDKNLSTQIYRGERRPVGHLLAQTLTFHSGCETAATLRYARVMRISVHPQLQGNGLGSFLLKEVVNHEQQQGVDAIGSSFGATLELLRFWQHAGFALVRMGFTRDHASGTHSAIMLKPLTAKGVTIFQQTRNSFHRNLHDWLMEPLNDLPDDMQAYLKSEQQDTDIELSEADWQDIHSFISTHRGYEACMGAVRKLVSDITDLPGQLSQTERKLVEARVKRRQSWAEAVKSTGLDGKAQALQYLREAIGKIVKNLEKK